MNGSKAIGLAISVFALAACGGDDQKAAQPLSGAELGKSAFRVCASCHTTAPRGTREGDMRMVGPNLHGIVGQPAAAVPGFAYSQAMRNSGLVWDEAALDAFIEHPQTVVRGTRMSFFGEPDPEKRKAIVDYLKTLK